MPSFQDSIVLFILALLLFGPKRLPVLARELGKWIGEFRRASNEFKSQMEEELRLSEQADRTKQIAAMEAAAPVAPALPDSVAESIPDPEHPHLPASTLATEPETEPAAEPVADVPAFEVVDGVRRPIPIATSGEVSIMPPSTGLPIPRTKATDPLGGLLSSIPETTAPETQNHGD
jgi:sec-independent protein translocase protein TatB